MIEQVNHFFLHPSPAQNLRWSLADWRISKPLNLSHKSCQSSLSPSLFSPVLTLGLPLLSPGEPLLGTLRNPIFSAGLTVPYLCPEATNPVSKTPSTSSELLLQLRLVRSTWWPMLYSKRPLLKYELIFFASITFVYLYFILITRLWTFWKAIITDWSMFPAKRCTGRGPGRQCLVTCRNMDSGKKLPFRVQSSTFKSELCHLLAVTQITARDHRTSLKGWLMITYA